MRHQRFATALLFFLLWSALASGADPRQSVVRFPTSGGLVLGADGRFVDGPVETIEGTLYLPSGAGPLPSVVLAHGCGGIGPNVTYWAAALSSAGYAVLIVDSFRPRGINRTCENLFELSAVRRLPDVYGALKWLSADARFDRRKVALMGFSHGGWVTVLASQAWSRDRFGGGDGFRAFLPFYPLCNAHYAERLSLTAPLRIHVGSADDYTQAAPCRVLVEDLKAKNLDARITVYEGAHHSFDNPELASLFFNPNGMSFTGCDAVGNSSKSILGPYDMEEIRPCIRTGVHVGSHPAATEAARRNVLAELGELDGPGH